MRHLLSGDEVRKLGYIPTKTLGWEDEKGEIYFQITRPYIEEVGEHVGVYHIDRATNELWAMDSDPWINHAPFEGTGIVVCSHRNRYDLTERLMTYHAYVDGVEVESTYLPSELAHYFVPQPS